MKNISILKLLDFLFGKTDIIGYQNIKLLSNKPIVVVIWLRKYRSCNRWPPGRNNVMAVITSLANQNKLTIVIMAKVL